MWKRFVLAIAIIAVLGSASPVPTLHVAFSEWPPFEYTEGGGIKGSDLEIAAAVFKEMGQQVVFESYPWERAVKMVKAGQVDAIMTLSRNPEREGYLVFPKTPINLSRNVLFVRKGSTIRFESYVNLAGLTIGTSAGYTYGADFEASTVFKRSEAVNEETNFRMLNGGRVDAFVCDQIVGVYFLKKMGMQDAIVQLPRVVSEFDMHIGFAKKPGAEALASSFDKALAAIKASGAYQRILDAYLK